MPTLHKLKTIAERLNEAQDSLGLMTTTHHLRGPVQAARRAVDAAISHYQTDPGNIGLIVDTLNPIADPLLGTQAEVLKAGSTQAAEQLARAITALELLLYQLSKK